jgi:hypothetical protein
MGSFKGTWIAFFNDFFAACSLFLSLHGPARCAASLSDLMFTLRRLEKDNGQGGMCENTVVHRDTNRSRHGYDSKA